MKKLSLTLFAIALAILPALAQSTELSDENTPVLEYIDVMPMPDMPGDDMVNNALDVILMLSKPELAARAIVNLKPKEANNEILQAIDVAFYIKDNVPHYAIGQRERALKRGAALVHISIGERTFEQVTVEVILFDKNGNEIGREVR